MFQALYRTLMVSYKTYESTWAPGMIATFSGTREVGKCTPSDVPIGFFVNNPLDENISVVDPTATISIGLGEYQTDVYEPGTFSPQDLLYCSYESKVSNNQTYRGNPVIGIVSGMDGSDLYFISHFSNLESVNKNFRNYEEPEIPTDKGSPGYFNRYTALLGDN